MDLIKKAFADLIGTLGEENIDLILERFQIEYRRARDKYQHASYSFFQKIDNWLIGMIRITAELLLEERIPWTIEKYISEEEISSTRKAIYHYTRDFSLNVLVIAIVLLIFIFVLIIYNKVIIL